MNLLIIASALLAATVTSKNLEEVYSDEKVVTAVSFDGLVTASVTNGLASAAALSAHASATNNPHGVTAAQLGALTAESDPAFDAWTNGTSIAIGFESSADDCVAIGTSSKARDLSVAIGETAKATGNSSVVIGCFSEATNSSTIVIGNMAHAIGRGSIAIGHEVYVTNESCIAFGEFPSNVLFGATYGAHWELDASARSLQSYLDERATTNALAAVSNELAKAISNATPSDYATVKANASSALSTANDVKAMISATDKTFSNAVLAVGLNIDTNAVAQINELLTDGAKLPTSGVATVGGLLAALAAGLAALKKSVSSLSSKVDDANAALEEVA